MQVSCGVHNTQDRFQENGQAIKDQNCFSQSLMSVNWIRPSTRVGDKPSNQSLPQNFCALFQIFIKCYV